MPTEHYVEQPGPYTNEPTLDPNATWIYIYDPYGYTWEINGYGVVTLTDGHSERAPGDGIWEPDDYAYYRSREEHYETVSGRLGGTAYILEVGAAAMALTGVAAPAAAVAAVAGLGSGTAALIAGYLADWWEDQAEQEEQDKPPEEGTD